VLRHDVHGMRRILGRLLCGWCIELGDVGRYDLCLPFSLQLSQDVFTDTVLVKVSFNRGDHLIYDRAINAGHYFIRHFPISKRR